jgi:hypothetical protein
MQATELKIGGAAGFSNDRPEGGIGLAQAFAASQEPAVIIFETLAERTLALAQQAKAADPQAGYEPQLEDYLSPILPICLKHDISIVGNFGAANPDAAALKISVMAKARGLGEVMLAKVQGDDLLAGFKPRQIMDWLIDGDDSCREDNLVSANVYLGAEPIARALAGGAQVVITGRVADPALAVGPLVNHFGWDWDDWDKLAAATMAGHLLECGSQVTGGYFADPGFKDVPDAAWLGYPIAGINADGSLVIGKTPNSGGLVDRRTVVEQLLYEIHDPAAYLTPDVVLDLTSVRVDEIGLNKVRLSGARGKPRPKMLKATVGFEDGFLGEGEISYAGVNALARAELAADILTRRMREFHPDCRMRTDLIGLSSLFSGDAAKAPPLSNAEPQEIRVRLAVHSQDPEPAKRAAREVTALYCCGPGGGAGVRTRVTPRLKTASALVPREAVHSEVSFMGGV